MLEIRNLNITHRKDLQELIKDFSFVLNEGDKVAIIGEEGNGKSTLLKLIYDEGLVSDYVEYNGQILKKDVRIAYLPQELEDENKGKTVYEYFCGNPCFYDMDNKELSDLAYKMGMELEMFYSQQHMGKLSGGEKVKMQMASIIMEKPQVLLLDEPSNDIDMSTLQWLEEFINNCGLSVVFISHDETLLENTANIIVHLEQIRRKTICRYTVAKMGYEEYVETRLKAFQRQEQMARKEKEEYEKQQEKFRRIQQKVEHDQKNVSRQNPHGGKLLKKKMHVVKSMEKRFEKQYENMTEMPHDEEAIMVKFNEDVQLPRGKVVLDFHRDELFVHQRILSRDINLKVMGGKKICIIGKNGVGKTTLIRSIAEELLQRKDIKASYMPQNYEEELDYNKTPVEFLSITWDKEENSRIRTFLGSMKYTTLEMEHNIGELSGGQKAKLFFLKMIMNKHNVLILDEPTRNFSALSNPVIRNILKEYGGTIISISHDRKFIREVADTVYEFTELGLKKIYF
ncbi:ATPase components of ABC transporters with duplicated ATPase domains [Hathewaya proteolytica DSM 3090]|uniref:ATPase components of ABC transporters with duplicated ATPase domains n=1 Tax=Hathewaya proteolytica DSM 3090 TaxID=1121331 RepID=A0A1M6M3D4_9CLOT|nr:ATP-binding cassette domain-containing protein [Hathewaya proteolytica]SHJ77873.1 ATPase components of ABC transporters with duplicated ATPase domains [Hathewaya proteolytica DSM 3090]